MAGNWIKFDTSTSDKPEVWAIAESLGIDPDAVVGKLLRVWAWFDDQTEKGNAPIVTRALLDRKVGVTGFVTAMVQAGWMVETDGLLTLPNFDRHNGQTAKNRILTAKRVAAHKKGNAGGNAKGNAPIVTGALPKEEKIRSEKKDTHTLTARAESVSVSDELAACWHRWSEYVLATTGKAVNAIQAEVMLMDLGRRGADKAARDIDFSINKSAKSILDSDHDFQKQASQPRTYGTTPRTRNYT
jgi:hypothetical protein